MKWVDRLLQRWRCHLAHPWVPVGSRVLDIGCHQGEFLDSLGATLKGGIGYDPLATPHANGRYRLVTEHFPIPAPFRSGSFDAIVMLATLEHIRDKEPVVSECHRLLCAGARGILS